MDSLPEELVLLVLGLLDERTLRRSVPLVCRQWAALARTRGAWQNAVLTFEREGDFAERADWEPPAVHAVELRRGADRLIRYHWAVLRACAQHARRVSGLGGSARLVSEVLERCWHSAQTVSLCVSAPLDQQTNARLWTLLASMPRLTELTLSVKLDPPAPGTPSSTMDWIEDPETEPQQLCWRWDEGWERLEVLDLRGVSPGPAAWLLGGFLRVRRTSLESVTLSGELNRPLMLQLRRCPRLRHIGVCCGSQLWRVDTLPQVVSLTLLGLPRRDTADWILQSPIVARLERLTLDGVNPSLFDILPAVGKACRRLTSLTFRRCQVPVRFAHQLDQCPIRELHAENMRAEHILEARRMPCLAFMRLSGHLGSYKTMMIAVACLKAAKPDLRIAGLDDGMYNHWGPGLHRALQFR